MMTFDNLIFAIRDTEEVPDEMIEAMIGELDDNPTRREKDQLETCLALNRPVLHFDLQNRLDLPCLPNMPNDNEFYSALT